MPNFNDNQPDPHFHSPKALLQSIAPHIPRDPADPAYQAMSELWARLVDKVPVYKRRVPTGHYSKTMQRRVDRALNNAILDALASRGLTDDPEAEFRRQLDQMPAATAEQLEQAKAISIEPEAPRDVGPFWNRSKPE